MDSHLKYAGEALFLVGAAYKLVRWAVGAVVEGDVPPSLVTGRPDDARDHIAGGLKTPQMVAQALMAPLEGHESHGVLDPYLYRTDFASTAPGPGDPDLFPPEMLNAMTPQQRAKIMESLIKTAGREVGARDGGVTR